MTNQEHTTLTNLQARLDTELANVEQLAKDLAAAQLRVGRTKLEIFNLVTQSVLTRPPGNQPQPTPPAPTPAADVFQRTPTVRDMVEAVLPHLSQPFTLADIRMKGEELFPSEDAVRKMIIGLPKEASDRVKAMDWVRLMRNDGKREALFHLRSKVSRPTATPQPTPTPPSAPVVRLSPPRPPVDNPPPQRAPITPPKSAPAPTPKAEPKASPAFDSADPLVINHSTRALDPAALHWLRTRQGTFSQTDVLAATGDTQRSWTWIATWTRLHYITTKSFGQYAATDRVPPGTPTS